MEKRKACLIGLIAVMMLLVLLTGCNQVSSQARSDTDRVTELADENEIPEDGIITAAQFQSIAGKDRTVVFKGTSPEGIEYEWVFNGQNIKNPVDQNLKVEFTLAGENLDSIKAAAAGAPYGLGLKLSDSQGLITVPELNIKLTEKWDADSGFLCKQVNGNLGKLSEVIVDNSGETTKLSTKVIETGDDYYIVAGKTTTTAVEGAQSGQADQATVSDGSGKSSDSSSQQTTSQGGYCTISISCATILNNMDNLTAGKESFVPSNGWILYATEVEFTAGESVHDVLKRVCQAYGIHMESSFTPAYNSAYVEGINQLYEFDCGELSGWMYNVNGWFPNYGCSQYTVADGDVINWVYTCDLGKDVGDNSMW
ncbi:MAG: hypothetical protein PWP30_620 [Eubacteriaceae bacterium]|nr:hypothetical protein [Eubacteriaceae bacterium]